MSSLMLLPCRTVCMNCLAWLRLNSSRWALASPIWRMPRFLFQMVLERVRMGMSTQMSRDLNAQVATLSARLTILPSVALSRSLMRLLAAAELVFRFGIGISRDAGVSPACVIKNAGETPASRHNQNSSSSDDGFFFFFFSLDFRGTR